MIFVHVGNGRPIWRVPCAETNRTWQLWWKFTWARVAAKRLARGLLAAGAHRGIARGHCAAAGAAVHRGGAAGEERRHSSGPVTHT